MQQADYYFWSKINKLHWILLFGIAVYMLMGGSTAYGYLGHLVVMAFFLREDLSPKDVFVSERKMTVSVFFQLLFLAQALNFSYLVFSFCMEPVLNAFGFSAGGFLKDQLEESIYEPTPFHEVLLFGFFGPIVEEIITRGYLMRSYQRYSGSKVYAIVFSAIIFGINHANFHTSVPIIFDALVLGYIAMEYGIFWTMIYHSIENFLTSHIFINEIVMRLPVEYRFPTCLSVVLIIALCALVILLLKRKHIIEYISDNGCERRYYKLTVKSIPFLLYVVMFMLLSLTRLYKI